jgi:hypothetical protein
MSVRVNEAIITDRASIVLAELQKDDNDFIDLYNRHLDKVVDLLFKLGNEMNFNQSKNEIFELLNNTHLLRKDLNALKAPKNESLTATQTSNDIH